MARNIPISFLCVLLALSAIDFNAQQNSDVALAIQSVSQTAKAGAPVRLDISIRNNSAESLVVDKASTKDGQAEAYAHVEVQDAFGRSLPRTDGQLFTKNGKTYVLPKRWMTRKGINLTPGYTIHDFMLLNNLFDLSKPGVYTVNATIEIRSPDSGPQIKWIGAKSNTAQITIIN